MKLEAKLYEGAFFPLAKDIFNLAVESKEDKQPIPIMGNRIWIMPENVELETSEEGLFGNIYSVKVKGLIVDKPEEAEREKDESGKATSSS